MGFPRIYTTEPLSENTGLSLQGPPGHHLARVLRRRAGDGVILFNGQGGEYEACIRSVDRNRVELDVGRYHPGDRESALHTELGLVVSKGDRMDWAIQKATELGVSKLTPLFSTYCDVKLSGDRVKKKLAHWQQVAISACEQCRRNRLPAIATPQALDQWLQQPAAFDLSLVFAPAGQPINSWQERSPTSLRLLVGPEGGFSENELSQAREAGFEPAQLGPRILRTETAPVAALAIAQWLWGDFQAED